MDPFGDICCTPRRAVILDKNFVLVGKPLETMPSFFQSNESDQEHVLQLLPSNCFIPDCAPVDDSSRPYNKPFLLKPRFRTHPSNVSLARDNRKLAVNIVELEDQDELSMAQLRHKKGTPR